MRTTFPKLKLTMNREELLAFFNEKDYKSFADYYNENCKVIHYHSIEDSVEGKNGYRYSKQELKRRWRIRETNIAHIVQNGMSWFIKRLRKGDYENLLSLPLKDQDLAFQVLELTDEDYIDFYNQGIHNKVLEVHKFYDPSPIDEYDEDKYESEEEFRYMRNGNNSVYALEERLNKFFIKLGEKI